MDSWKKIIFDNLALIFSLSIVIYFYSPLLLPIFDNRLEFSYGDFSNIISDNSALIRKNISFFTFDDFRGVQSIDTSRAFLLESIALLGPYLHLSDSQIQSIIILISILLGSYGLYQLITLFEKNKFHRSLLILIIIPFYFLNLWCVERIGHVWIWTAYAIFPLFLFFGISYILTKKLSYLVIYSLLFAIFGIIPHSFFYLLILHLFLIIFNIYSLEKIKYLLFFSMIPIFLYLLLNLPLFSLIFARGISYPIPITLDMLAMTSRYGELIKLFTFSNNWWPQVPKEIIFTNLEFRVSSLAILFSILLVATISLKIKKNTDNTRFLILLSLLFFLALVFIAQGTNNFLLSEILQIMGKNNLLHIVAPFREWTRIIILSPIFLSLILIASFSKLRNREKYCVFTVLTFLIGLNIFSSPGLTYLNKVYYPVYVPEEYYELGTNISTEYKTLWLYPSQAENVLGTWRAVWNYGKTPPLLEYSVGSTYPNHFDLIRLIKIREAPHSILDILNIKYIIQRTDILGASNFNANYSWMNCKKLEFLILCKNEHNITKFNTYPAGIFINGDSQKLYSLLPLSQNYFTSTDNNKLINFVLFDSTLSTIQQKLLEIGVNVINPFSFSYRHDPSRVWSKASTSDPLHADWHSYLERYGINNRQSDYGKGLVFTWAPLILKEPSSLKNDDLINRLEFEKNKEGFESLSSPVLNISLNKKAVSGSSSLTAIIAQGDTWGWKVASSDFIPIKENNYYKVSMFVSGKDINKLHAKIVYYNEDEEEVGIDFIFGETSGSFDFKKFENTILTPKGSSKVKIQLWAWQNPNATSYWWLDELRIYDLTKYTEKNILNMPFEVDESNNYKLFIRYFKNQAGGKIGIYLDNKLIKIINTEDQLNKFVWVEVAELNLKKGKHTLSLENIEGFNAVNIFALIPSEKFSEYEQKVKELLENKRILYLFEAESDMYHENSKVLDSEEDSNGKVIELTSNSKIWEEIEILKDDKYRIVLKLKGDLEVKIDDQTFRVNSSKLDFICLPSIYLTKGKHKIEIKSPPILKPINWDFENTKDLTEWNELSTKDIQKLFLENGNLKVELYNSSWGWKTINSPLIPATVEKIYEWSFKIKGENSHEVHAKIMEYNSNREYITGHYVVGIGDGTFDWKNVSIKFKPTNSSTAYIQLQIWHGHETNKPLPNKIWIDNVKTFGYQTSYLDVIWIYSVKQNETLKDVFTPKGTPAEVRSYTKINPTLWKVQINSTEPFMLSFAESYDPQWEARVYKDSKKVETVKSIPLYSIINGFWINTTGENLEIIIRYKPQDYFEFGLAVSSITFFSCIAYLIYDWKRDFFNDKFHLIKTKIKKQKYSYKPRK